MGWGREECDYSFKKIMKSLLSKERTIRVAWFKMTKFLKSEKVGKVILEAELRLGGGRGEIDTESSKQFP